MTLEDFSIRRSQAENLLVKEETAVEKDSCMAYTGEFVLKNRHKGREMKKGKAIQRTKMKAFNTCRAQRQNRQRSGEKSRGNELRFVLLSLLYVYIHQRDIQDRQKHIPHTNTGIGPRVTPSSRSSYPQIDLSTYLYLATREGRPSMLESFPSHRLCLDVRMQIYPLGCIILCICSDR